MTKRLTPESIGKFVGIGGGFLSHVEAKDRTYRWPDLWVVPAECLTNEGEAIEIPERVERVKPGSELTAVVGEDLFRADEAEAWSGVEGFTVSNDVTASGDWPGWSDPDHPNITGVGYKLFPTFNPLSSEYVERGEESEYYDLHVEVRVDGETIASGSTAEMGFSIPEMVSFASNIVPLHENDVVALGEPGDPDRFLDDADEVTCSIESVGELTNPIERL